MSDSIGMAYRKGFLEGRSALNAEMDPTLITNYRPSIRPGWLEHELRRAPHSRCRVALTVAGVECLEHVG